VEPILEGIRVVELGQAFAGPFAAEILANLGAEVVKVERPNGGDETRRWGPPFWGEDAAVFHSINRNKRSVALDLKDAEDHALCDQLIGSADVLVHNFRPGALDRLGFGAEALANRHPRLIYAEISAFGHTGPLRNQPGYEILSQAFGGVMSITGEAERAPVRCGPSICDFGAAMWLAVGVLASLVRRSRTGRGGLVQTSLFETALSWTTVSASSYLASGNEPGRMGTSHHLVAPYGYFRSKTEPLMIACGSDALFVKLTKVLGCPELAEDPRFRDTSSRVKNKSLLETLVNDRTQEQECDHWFSRLTEAGVPCSPVNTIPDALDHDQTEALGMLMTDPDDSEVKSLGFPVVFDGERPGLRRGAPKLGADTDEIVEGVKG